jgi:hypothetical protein
MKVIILCLLSFLFSCGNHNVEFSVEDKNSIKQVEDKDILETGFCELIESPEKFDKKLIRVKAVYRYGFEWSEIYSLKCETKKRIWVERIEKACKNASPIDKLASAQKGGKTVGIIAVGRFRDGKDGRYGHLNGYNFQFEIECFDKAKILDNEGFVPQALTPDQRRVIEEFENSK